MRYTPDSCPEQNAPWNQPDDNRATVYCAICNAIGRVDGDEYSDTTTNRIMQGARLSPDNDWTCSSGCYSQLMYDKASEYEQFALKEVETACLALYEHLDAVKPLIDKWFEYTFDLDKLALCVNQTRALLAVDEEPKWISENIPLDEKVQDLLVKISQPNNGFLPAANLPRLQVVR